MQKIVCKICIEERGLIGSELEERGFNTNEELIQHIEKEHNIPVRRPNETEDEAIARVKKMYPEAGNIDTCKCPQCRAKRMLENMDNVAG